jgi:hypothetical protein
VEESAMEGLTPPNSPKNCKSCMLFAGDLFVLLKAFNFFVNQLKIKGLENKI